MKTSTCRFCCVSSVVVVLFGGCASRALAQSGPSSPDAVTVAPPEEIRKAPGFKKLLKDAIGDFRQVPSTRSAGLLLLGASFAASVHPLDARLSNHVSATTGDSQAFVPGRVLGGAQFQFGAAFATYGIGRLTGKPRVAEVGSHLLRAQLVAQTMTQAVKFSVRRMRPDDSTANSFPSGHTSVSFASATVLQREFGWKVGLPAYAVASYIGYSRIEHKRHYLSDVIVGAAIGVVAGRSVTIGFGDKRFMVAPVATRGGGGVSFTLAGQR